MNIKELVKGGITQEELLNYYNANITIERLPRYINGFVFNYRGINNIIINKNLSDLCQKYTVIHELAHIELCHLNQINDFLEFSIAKYEDQVDKYIEKLRKEICNETSDKMVPKL